MALSTFMGLETALRGVLVHQRALDTTGHNIANVNTVGYSRQRAELGEMAPLRDYPYGMIGTGVTVEKYTRIRDAFLDTQLRAQTMLQGYHEARQDGLSQVELALNEPSDNGLQAQLQKFWNAWQDLSNNPESTAVRQALLEQSAALAAGFQDLRAQLVSVSAQAVTEQGLTVNDVNSLVGQMAALDQQIMSQKASGVDPSNDLLDRRDVLLDQLGKLANISTAEQPDGSLTVQIGTYTVLSAGTQTTVASVAALGANLTSGKLQGLVSLDTTISGAGGYISRLDGVAGSLITAVNTLQTGGFDLTGAAATNAFFTGTNASSIAVNTALTANPALIGASSAANQPGNGSNALAIAALRNSASIDQAYSGLVTTIGSDSQTAQRNAANAGVLVDSLENRRDSVSGVSIDEEMTNLVRFQRGYQAAARALTAMDDMIDTLVNRTGRVGL